jgi:hypothetical protein
MKETAPGGLLAVHADFNRYKKYGLDRRVNVFLYLTPDWQREWGGDLELWGTDMEACVKTISPLFNRLVVFMSTDVTYHGHPEPLPAPVSRRALSLYYYTNGRPPEETSAFECELNEHTCTAVRSSHSTQWQEIMCPTGDTCRECGASLV